MSTSTFNYVFVGATETSYTYSETTNLFKNLTFSPSFINNVATRTYYKPDEILGLIGGISFFIILVTSCLGRRVNKLKMYTAIGDRLMFSRKQEELVEEKPVAKYEGLHLNEWEVVQYSMGSFLYAGKLACYRNDERYQKAMTLRANVQYELDLASFLQTLNATKIRQSQNFLPNEKRIIDLHIKDVMGQVKAGDPYDGLNPESQAQLQKLAQANELTPQEVAVIARAARAGVDLSGVLGEQYRKLHGDKKHSGPKKLPPISHPPKHEINDVHPKPSEVNIYKFDSDSDRE